MNLDEALWKCSSATCLYPFNDFKFKNFTDSTVYIYRKPVGQSADEKTVSPDPRSPVKQEKDVENKKFSPKKIFNKAISTAPIQTPTIDEFDFDTFTADLFKTDSPEDSQSSFEYKGDFDLIDEYSGAQPKPPNTVVVEQQLDLNGLNDMLDDIISEYSNESFDIGAAKSTKIEQVDTEKVVAVAPGSLPIVDLVKESVGDQDSKVQMPLPRLTKCLKHIEDKIRIKKEKMLDDAADPLAIKISGPKRFNTPKVKIEQPTKSGGRHEPKQRANVRTTMLRKSPIKPGCVNSTLISLVSQRDNLKPLSVLRRLTSLDFSKASSETLNKIVLPIAQQPIANYRSMK